MDANAARDHMLLHTSEAARQYGVSETAVAAAMASLPRHARYRVALSSGRYHAHFVRVAEAHRAECDRADCRTCDEIRKGLAVMLATVRKQLNAEMQSMLGRSPRRWWQVWRPRGL